MKKQKLIALLLAGVLALGLCATALAADPVPGEQGQTEEQLPPEEESREEEQDAQAEQPSQDIPAPAEEEIGGQEGGAAPSRPGTLSFEDVEGEVRAGNLNFLILEESVAQTEVIDYDEMQEDLVDALNGLADMQWQVYNMGAILPSTGDEKVDAALKSAMSISGSMTAQSLNAQYEALREQLDDLKEGKLQQDMADGVRQMRAAQDSLVLVTQSMYIQLSELEASAAALDRALDALDRQLTELELRYQLGQVSALTLRQTQSARTTLASQTESVENSLSALTMSLESMLGRELTGTLTLSALPQVSGEALEAMDLEADLAAARAASYELYAAQKTLDDARETFEEAAEDYNYDTGSYLYIQAQHTLQAAEYTYQGAQQSFELSFRTLYNQVKDCAQVLGAARTALAVEEDNYAVDQLKYEQGTISQNALLTARDDLETARDTVDTALRSLFSAYNNYRWAVDYGILS